MIRLRGGARTKKNGNNANAKARREKRLKNAWIQESSEFSGQPWFEERKRELEEGASIVASEECSDRWNGEADPELCLAARKGEAKRAAASEARLKERTRKAILNRNAGERWNNAQGPLLAMAAQYGNTPNNFSAVYNGVPTGKKVTKKNPNPRAYEEGTGTWLPGRNVPNYYPYGKPQKAWKPMRPSEWKQVRGENWQAPPQQNGDFLNPDARIEILARVFPEFPVSGPNKEKFPVERALYDEIKAGLKMVRYEKGFENAETHQPQLDVYDQGYSRAMNWRRKGVVTI
jgi:hypothetical protein